MVVRYYVWKNLKLFRKLYGLTQAELGRILDVSKDAIYTYEKGRTVPHSIDINRICKTAGVTVDDFMFKDMKEEDFPIENILKGKKRKLRPTAQKDQIINSTNDTNATNITIAAEKVEEYQATPLTKTKVIDKHLDQNIIPVFPAGGSASHTELYNDLGNKPEGFIRVPGYEDCDFATYAYGHSMYPVIESGCLILCRKTQGKQMILWGEIYYIITQDYRLIKRLQKGSTKSTVMAVSENDEKRRDGERKYEGIEIEIDDIKELYLVKGIIKKIQI